MLDFYRSLSPREKALVWIAAIAVIVVIVSLGGENAGIVAGAQVAAAVGTLTLAALAYSQLRELRETRIAQERPQVIVDADYSQSPLINVVVRNIGKGAAKDITFDFSAPMVSSLSVDEHTVAVPLNELPYFDKGIDFLAPSAEIVSAWDSLISLRPILRDRGLEDGITVTSKYKSLNGDSYTTEWTINPLRIETYEFPEKDIKDLVKVVEKFQKDFHKVVGPLSRELRVSTETERQERQRQKEAEERQD